MGVYPSMALFFARYDIFVPSIPIEDSYMRDRFANSILAAAAALALFSLAVIPGAAQEQAQKKGAADKGPVIILPTPNSP